MPLPQFIGPLEVVTSASVASEEIGVRCTEVYLEHVYFQMPVLQVSSLLTAHSKICSPFSPGSLLYHGLVASCVPWMNHQSLVWDDCSTRGDALELQLKLFEVC